jgi:hypothetical protein
MNVTPTPVRVFRVTDNRAPCSVTFVFEYTALGEFKEAGVFQYGDRSTVEAARSANDRDGIFNVLNTLRNRALHGKPHESKRVALSIDEAVSQGEARLRELTGRMERWRAEADLTTSRKAEPSAPPACGADREISGSLIAREHDHSPNERVDQEIDKLIEEVWKYARGVDLRWKRVGRTPDGRDYDVLTVDGAEQLYPGPTSIETSPSRDLGDGFRR